MKFNTQGSAMASRRESDLPPKNRSSCYIRIWVKNLLIKGSRMVRKRYSPEQIIGYLREAEILQAKGSPIPQICKKIGVVEQTYYRWRKEYGNLSVDQARRLKEVEKENIRLKKLVADLSLDKAILKEVAEGKY